MKKVLSVLLVLLLFIPMLVLADGGGPIFASYEAYVSDKNGASLYEEIYEDGENYYKKTSHLLEYNHKIKIYDEYEIDDGIFYGEVEYEDKVYYINLAKISIDKEEYTLEDVKKDFDDEDEYAPYYEKLLLINSIDLFNGPSVKYSVKQKNLKVGETYDILAEFSNYLLVKRGDTYGWIYSDYSDFATMEEDGIWLLEDKEAYDGLSTSDSNKVGTISKDTKFDEVYTYYDETDSEDENVSYYIVKYENKYCYINTKLVATKFKNDSNIKMLIKETGLYDVVLGEELEKLPEYFVFEPTYNAYVRESSKGYTWYYFEKGDKKGWIKEANENVAEYSDSFIMTYTEADLYDKIGGNVSNTLKENKEIEGYYEAYVNGRTWFYIKVNDKNYWAKRDDFVVKINEEYFDEYNVEKDKKIYEVVGGDPGETVIPSGTTVKVLYYYEYEKDDDYQVWYYVDGKGYKGWVNDDDDDSMAEIKTTIETAIANEQVSPMISSMNRIDKQKQGSKSEPDVIKVEKKLSKKEMIYIGLLCAVIFALVIVIIILLINKKKENKVNNKTEETVEKIKIPEAVEITQQSALEPPVEVNTSKQEVSNNVDNHE